MVIDLFIFILLCIQGIHDVDLCIFLNLECGIVECGTVECGMNDDDDRHGKGPPSPQPELVTKCQKHDFSNLYKELGYDSTHNFDIVACSLYSLGDRKAISKITTLIGKP